MRKEKQKKEVSINVQVSSWIWDRFEARCISEKKDPNKILADLATKEVQEMIQDYIIEKMYEYKVKRL